MKLAKVIPLYKNGDKMIISNYRYAFLLSVFSKILERGMYGRIMDLWCCTSFNLASARNSLHQWYYPCWWIELLVLLTTTKVNTLWICF